MRSAMAEEDDDAITPDVHPIDFDKVQKGDYISPEDCDAAMGTTQETPNRWSHLLELRAQVEERTGIVTRTERGGLRLLQDSASLEFVPMRFDAHKKGLERQARRLGLIDPDNLTSNEKTRLQGTRAHAAMVVAAVSAVERREALIASLTPKEIP